MNTKLKYDNESFSEKFQRLMVDKNFEPGSVWMPQSYLDSGSLPNNQTLVINFSYRAITASKPEGVQAVWCTNPGSRRLVWHERETFKHLIRNRNFEYSHQDLNLVNYYPTVAGQNYPPHFPAPLTVWMDRTGRALEIQNWFKPASYPLQDYTAQCRVLNPQPGQRKNVGIGVSNFGTKLTLVDLNQAIKKELEEDSEFVLKL